MTDKPTISLQAAARAVAVDYAGSSDEDPNVTEYMLRMADRIDELEEALDSAADLQTIHIAKTTLEDIAAGRGMFGLVAEEDLKWVMSLAGKTAEVIEERIKK